MESPTSEPCPHKNCKSTAPTVRCKMFEFCVVSPVSHISVALDECSNTEAVQVSFIFLEVLDSASGRKRSDEICWTD